MVTARTATTSTGANASRTAAASPWRTLPRPCGRPERQVRPTVRQVHSAIRRQQVVPRRERPAARRHRPAGARQRAPPLPRRGEDGQLLSLKRRIQVLTREADAKDQLYRDKSLEARGLRHTVKDLDKKLADCKERYDGASITLKIRDREIRERDEVIRQQNATIQRLEHELRHARRDGW
ncbi:hypothetical protein PG987_013580 [Apiospora arundinis]